MVRLTVAAGVEPESFLGLARRRGEGCDATQMRERSFVLQPMRVVAGGDEQDRSGVGADAVDLEQFRCAATHQGVEDIVEASTVGVEREDATSQRRDRQFRRVHDGVAPDGGTQRRRGGRQLVGGHVPEPFAQLVGSGEPEMADLIQVLDAHVAARAARHEQRADRFDVSIGGLRDP